LEAKNVIAKPKDSLFVRYYLPTADGKGDTVNTREVMATPDPQWKQNFSLDCGVSTVDVDVISELQKKSVKFELRERSSRIKVLGSLFGGSKLIGSVEIPWKNLLQSPMSLTHNWFPLKPSTGAGGSQLEPTLHVAVCAIQYVVESAPRPHREYRTDTAIYDPEAMGGRKDLRRLSLSMDKRIKRLEQYDQEDYRWTVFPEGE